jgi:serine/threonine-protein kinase
MSVPPPCTGQRGNLPRYCPGWCLHAQPCQTATETRRIPESWEGELIGRRWLLGGRIGAGAMGEVFAGVETSTGEPVAVKVLRGARSQHRASVDRFVMEARALARIGHTNVVRMRACGVDRGAPYVVMEHLGGITLADVLRGLQGRPIPLGRALGLLRGVLDGVEAMHAVGVLHRDLKPANVMLTTEGRVVVMDLGLAQPFGPSCRGEPDVVLGTPAYVAPELAEASMGPLDVTSDIYALGVMAFEMLTGRLPFVSKTVTGVLTKHLHVPPPRPSAIRTELPAWIDQAILGALEKNVDKRTRTVSTLRKQLLAREGGRASVCCL